MGCDIHLRAETFVDGRWVLYEGSIYGSRSYETFAILADVRNGYGFAGCDTGDRLNPIAEPRGLPLDMSPELQRIAADYADGWLGEHSFSWLTLAEILAFDWTQVATLRGWVNGVEFEEWDRLKEWDPEPKTYCGGVSGGGVEHISEEEMRRRVAAIKANAKTHDEQVEALKTLGSTYCQVSWKMTYADCAGTFWTVAVPKLLRLGKPENVRIVFGFDS